MAHDDGCVVPSLVIHLHINNANKVSLVWLLCQWSDYSTCDVGLQLTGFRNMSLLYLQKDIFS